MYSNIEVSFRETVPLMYGVGATVEKLRLELVFPSSAMDQFGNTGTWTMIYNQVGGVCLRQFGQLHRTFQTLKPPNNSTQRGYSLYRGTHFKDNEGFEANWMQCEAF